MAAYGGPDCQETAKLILLADRFFDCLNGRAVFEGDHKRKPDLMPYRSQNDPRFDVRKIIFIHNVHMSDFHC